MAHYHCILFDLDNTLLDFDAAEYKAISETFVQAGIPATNELIEKYHAINESLWALLEKGQMRREKIATERFVRLLKETQLEGDGIAMARAFRENLALQGALVPNALEVLRELSEVATLVVVSNGFAQVQDSRMNIAGLGAFVEESFISEKVGVDKPNRKIFDVALSTLGIEQRERVLVVGDRLQSDIKGGQNAGLATCWFNPQAEENKGAVKPLYEIQSLTELYKIVMEVDEIERIGIKNRKHSI